MRARRPTGTAVQSLRGNAFWQLCQNVLTVGTDLLVVLTLAAELPAAEFGKLAVVLSGAKLIFLSVELRIHEFLVPKLARYLGKSAHAVWSSFKWARRAEGLANVTGLVLCLIVGSAAVALDAGPTLALVTAASLYAFSNTLFKYSSISVFRCLGIVRFAALISGIPAVLRCAVLLFSYRAAWPPSTLLLSLAAIGTVFGAVQTLLVRHELARAVPPVRIVRRPLRPANRSRQLRLLLSNYGNGVVDIFHREFDIQLAAILGGAEQAGRYRLAKAIAQLVLEAMNPVVLMLLPEFARRLSGKAREELRPFIRKVRVLLIVVALASCALVLVGAQVYVTMFAPAQSNVRVPIVVILLAYVSVAPWIWCQAFLVAAGLPAKYLRSSVAGAGVAICAAALLVPWLGAVGSATAHGIGLLTTTMLAALAVRKARVFQGAPS